MPEYQFSPLPWSVEEQWATDVDKRPFVFAYWIADADGVEVARSIMDRGIATQFTAVPALVEALKALGAEALPELGDEHPAIVQALAALTLAGEK